MVSLALAPLGVRNWAMVMKKVASAPYHHGNLRQAALDQAVSLVRCANADAVSIRAIAGKLGVAHRAIYNHFADRAALLRAVAAAGFDELAQTMPQQKGIAGIAAAYCRFALANPGLYQTMMATPNLTIRDDKGLAATVARLLRIIAERWPDDSVNPPSREAITRVWLVLHGGIALHHSGILGAADEADLVARLTAMAVS
jgi:AcrR family transcriptional regulator